VSSPFTCPGQKKTRDESSIDWNTNIPEALVSLQPHVSPIGEHISLPHVSLGSNGNSETNVML